MGNTVDIDNLKQALDENNSRILNESAISKAGVTLSQKNNNAICEKDDGLYIESLSEQLDAAIDSLKRNTPLGFASIKTESIPAQLPELPYAFLHGSAISFKGLIHILGGSGDYTGHYYYSERNNEWIKYTFPLPMAFSRGCAVPCNDGLYILGGSASNNTTARKSGYVWKETETGSNLYTWSAIADMPANRIDFGACSAGNKIYVAGGRSGNTYYKTLYCYDPDTNTWASLSDMPAARAMGTLYVNPCNNNELYYVGQHTGAALTIYKYDIEGNVWSDISADTIPNGNITINEVFSYTTTGQSVAVNPDTKESILFTETDVYIRRHERRWEWLNYNLNLPQKYAVKIFHNGELYLIGGNATEYRNMFAKYETMGFFNKTSSPTPLNMLRTACCYWRGKIHYFGTASSTSYQYIHFTYTPKTNEWHYESTLPFKIVEGTVAASTYGIHLLGIIAENIVTNKYSNDDTSENVIVDKGNGVYFSYDGKKWEYNGVNYYFTHGTYNLTCYNDVLYLAQCTRINTDYLYEIQKFGLLKHNGHIILEVKNGSILNSETVGAYRTLIWYDGNMHVLSGSGDGNLHEILEIGTRTAISCKDLAYSSTTGSCAVVLHGKLYIFLGQYIQEYCSKNGIESPFTTTYDFGKTFIGASIVKDEDTDIIYVALNNDFYKLIISN